uniref:Putative RecF/RecN/SMC domain contining protein n=1 Tax=viral metagenome TaxID=1070528 RepID=A0A6M3IMJ5_9ZZZZ
MTTNTLEQIFAEVQRRIGQRDRVTSDLGKAKAEVDRLSVEQGHLIRALEIIQTVAKLTQQELEIHVSELVSLALEAVFPRPYKLVLSFELRRNRSEADLLLEDGDGNRVRPMDAVGGGVVDVAAFALRIALWSLRNPRSRPTIILDEPMRFVSRDLQGRASAMMKEISKRLGIQFLIVSHEETICEAADKVFFISLRDGVSKVE